MISIILDTNVFVSGIFWKGPPYSILDAWYRHTIKLIYSMNILDEYIRVSELLLKKYKEINIFSIVNLVTIYGELHTPVILKDAVTEDPDDDKFIACALGAGCNLIVSGDQDLLKVNGFRNIKIIKPAFFVKNYIK